MAVQQQSSFTLAGTGDAIITRELLPYEGVAREFDDLLTILREADTTVTNFEVLAHDYEGPAATTSGGTYMRAPPSVLDELVGMGCNLFSAATNHAFDYGQTGIEQTLSAFENRGLPVAGLGRNRFEARRPAYLETPAGRVALVSVCTSVTPGSAAGEQTQALSGRPGVNPLDVELIYRLPESASHHLEQLSDAVGFEKQKQDWLERGLYFNHDWDQDEYLHFGDMKFEVVEEDGGIEYQVDSDDANEVLDWIREARANANWVIVSVHSHQGVDGRQNTPETPKFLQELYREIADAGADAVIGTGPHVLRGVERYNGVPLFYSLGNFILQDETIDRLPPENYRRYGIREFTKPSRAFEARNHDSDGNVMGDRANPDCWRTVIPVCEFEDETLDLTVYPVTLQQEQRRPQCGIPVLATGTEADEILETLAERSEPFGTRVEIEDGVGTVHPE